GRRSPTASEDRSAAERREPERRLSRASALPGRVAVGVALPRLAGGRNRAPVERARCSSALPPSAEGDATTRGYCELPLGRQDRASAPHVAGTARRRRA